MSYANISLFIPHSGCLHQCSFCNQKQITGQLHQPQPQDVVSAVEKALSSGSLDGEHTEIAFFGGSFTAVDPDYQTALLKAAYPYVQSGAVCGIRISTRPDAIDALTLERLQEFGVTSIELGAQSMVDAVLKANHRGHTAEQVRLASRMILEFGFSLGLQMMTGLDTDSPEGAKQTARELALLSPQTMRIYPTVVLEDTPLARRYRCGAYHPMELDEAVALCGDLAAYFEERGIRVIRLGLHSSPELEHRLAGPYHPAFAELCYGQQFLKKIIRFLETNRIAPNSLQIRVNPRHLSRAIGQGKRNVEALAQMGYACRFLGDSAVLPGAFEIEISEKR